ncbi:hypothetical protein EDB81DRAFT_755867 [Dactylonectria macrodidyma]|uniref:Uncharacterized protein n=1 Tax=Dactylonectria macrodidyma TaxID=307937 RepID=A0A9P9FHR0_9HYPO|nr:hypothetical protein EDB81DRAFT_755867 [Dactylonectria macrodidyma]
MSNPGHNHGQGMPSQDAEYPPHGRRDDTDLQGGPHWAASGSTAQAVSHHERDYHSPPYGSYASRGASSAAYEYAVDSTSRGSAARVQWTDGGGVGLNPHDQQGYVTVSNAYANTHTVGQQNRTDGFSLGASLSASPSSTLANPGSCASTMQEEGSYLSRVSSYFGVSHDLNVANYPSNMARFLASSSRSDIQESLQQFHSHFLPQDRGQDNTVWYAPDLGLSSSESDDGETDDKHGKVSRKSGRNVKSDSKPKSSRGKWRGKWRGTSEDKKKSGKNDRESRNGRNSQVTLVSAHVPESSPPAQNLTEFCALEGHPGSLEKDSHCIKRLIG